MGLLSKLFNRKSEIVNSITETAAQANPRLIQLQKPLKNG